MATRSPNNRKSDTVEAAAAELIGLFGRVSRSLKRCAEPAPSELVVIFDTESLGRRHGPVLFAVALESEMSVTEIAARIGLGVPTTSLLVGELSRAGLVRRTEDDEDRRRTKVSLHEEHREAIEVWIEEAMNPLRKTLLRLSAAERATFLKAWRILDQESCQVGLDGRDRCQ